MEQIQEQDERCSDGMKEAAREVDHLAIAGKPKKAFKKAGGFSIKPGPAPFCAERRALRQQTGRYGDHRRNPKKAICHALLGNLPSDFTGPMSVRLSINALRAVQVP